MLCGLLVSLDAASPLYGKEITHLSSEKDSRGEIKKMRSKKCGATRKASTAA
jgi:hypothetical protein